MTQRLVAALWFGSSVFLMIAASAVFQAAPSARAAADIVGAMLTRWHYIALAAPLILFAFELRRVRVSVLSILFAAILIAAGQGIVDLRIRSIRDSVVSISDLSRDDEIRRRFGALHGISMLLLALQVVASAAVVASKPKEAREAEPPPPATGASSTSPIA